MDRRQFLVGAASLMGAGLLAACSKKTGSVGGGPTVSATHPPLSSEPGTLSILEWGGYEASGTKAQTYGLKAGKDYTDKFGTDGLTYTYITNDDQALQKATSGGPFDVIHPCNENIPDYVNRGLVQPWDTSLLPSYKNLNPALTERGKINGQQYFIPWDWGYASILYRTDKVDPADATGWELFWNPKYKGRIAMWDGAQSNFEVAALKLGFPEMDNQTSDQVEQSKQALIEQKPLNKFYWKSEYSDMQPAFKAGDIWITYSWQDAYVNMKAAGLPVEFMQPSQGKLGWVCGFMLGASTKSYRHAHEYVESFINHKAAVDMVNLFYYGNADATITAADVENKALAKKLNIGDPKALEGEGVHIQSWMPNEDEVALAWQEVSAA